jgi:hypothetical protein
MAFTKTVGGVNPWSMPSDGVDFVSISRETKKWERQRYHRGSRREGKKEIIVEIEAIKTPVFFGDSEWDYI